MPLKKIFIISRWTVRCFCCVVVRQWHRQEQAVVLVESSWWCVSGNINVLGNKTHLSTAAALPTNREVLRYIEMEPRPTFIFSGKSWWWSSIKMWTERNIINKDEQTFAAWLLTMQPICGDNRTVINHKTKFHVVLLLSAINSFNMHSFVIIN